MPDAPTPPDVEARLKEIEAWFNATEFLDEEQAETQIVWLLNTVRAALRREAALAGDGSPTAQLRGVGQALGDNPVCRVCGIGYCSAHTVADQVAALVKSEAALREALTDLRDLQNGPPLLKYEAAWNEVMATIEKLLTPGGPRTEVEG